MGRIALVTPDASFEHDLKVAVPEHAAGSPLRWREEYLRVDPTKVVADVGDGDAEVVCLGPGLVPSTALQLADAFDRERPDMCVVLVAEPTTDLVREALRVGVRDVVAPSADPTELRQALSRALDAADRRHRSRGEAAEPARSSQVVTVLSPKGGTGKTTLATNLAVGLAASRPGQVAIVDLDVQFGDVASALQLTPKTGLGDVAACPDRVTATMVKVFLSAHPSGLYALCAPETPAEGDNVTADHVAQALRLLAAEFQTVVVDTGAGLGEHSLAAIELSTDLLVVSTPEVTSVRSLRKALDALDLLGMTKARRHFVLNRSDVRGGLGLGDIESVMGMKCDFLIGGSQSVPESTNLGSPVIESEPRSAVSRQLQKLVERFLVDGAAEAEEPRIAPASGFGLWRRSGR